MFVEDRDEDAQLIVKGFDHCYGVDLELQRARDGQHAIDLLFEAAELKSPYDLILLDLDIPKVNGIELIRAIQTCPFHKSKPLVVLTSCDANEKVHECYASGASSFVVKPVDPSSFVETVSLVGMYWLTLNCCRGA